MQKKKKKQLQPVKNKVADSENLRQQIRDDSDNACRCKEISRKTFPELLKVMISDLSPWKKQIKGE